MSLDDRSLHEHLDRRAEAGLTDVAQTADVVLARVAEIDRGPWWSRFGVRTPSLGVSAAAVVVLIVALAALSPRLWPGPGSSPGDSAAVLSDYPAARAMTADELDGLLINPGDWTGLLLIADVELSPWDLPCDSSPCPDLETKLARNTVGVYGNDPVLGGPYAFRVRADGNFELVQAVKPGGDGLAWTLPQLTAALPDLRAADRSVPYAYLVDAVRVVSSAAIPCPNAESPRVGPDFSCNPGIAWLVPDESPGPSDGFSPPAGGLRVPNAFGPPERRRGYWLVDPLVAQESCFQCPPAGAADLVGRVAGLGELVRAIPTPYESFNPSPTPAVTTAIVEDITFSTNQIRLDGFETADLTVTVSFANDVVPYHGADASMTPLLYFLRDAGDTGDPLDPHIAQLVRTMRESPVAGVWTATFRLTSGDRGTWHVDGLVAYDADGQELRIGPAIRDLSPKLEVVGTSAPFLTMEVRPWPVELGQPLEVSGQVTNQDSGDPIGYALLTIGRGDSCGPGGTGTSVRANVNGVYTYAVPDADSSLVCAWISGDPFTYPSPDSDVPVALYAALFADPQAP